MFAKILTLLHLSLLSLAMATEELTTTTHGNTWKYGTGGGLIGFVVLILDIIVFSMSFFLYRDVHGANMIVQWKY